MNQKEILGCLADILVNDVVKRGFNVITFTKLTDVLNRKYRKALPPSEVDQYLEELSLICFALELPLLNALVVGRNYQPSPRFFNQYESLYRRTAFDKRSVHESEVQKVLEVTDWTKLFTRLNDGQPIPQPQGVVRTPIVEKPQIQANSQLQSEMEYEKTLQERVKKAMEEGMIARQDRLKVASKKPNQLTVTKIVYDVNPDVIAEVLHRAGGFCEHCGQIAPFYRTSDYKPYLEIYRKTSFEQGGEDTPENTLAVCPNCHQKLEDQRIKF